MIGMTLISFNATDGRILEADILFNDADYVFSTTQETNLSIVISVTGELRISGVVNLQNVVTHEIGHFCGLGHSYIDGNLKSVSVGSMGELVPSPIPDQTATMYPFEVWMGRTPSGFVELRSSRARTLKHDDIAGISYLYPEPEFLTSFGAIEGRIVSALDPTEPVFGAHVVAVNSLQREVVSTLSRKDGTFRLVGLPVDGQYTIFAEPIPFMSTAQGYYQTAEQIFPQEFYDDAFRVSEARRVTVQAGQVTGDILHTVLVGFPEEDPNEPNNSFTEFTNANPDSYLAGIIKPEGDRDFFRFRALRGSLIRIEVEAQRLNTRLIPLLILYDANGVEIARNSNFFGLDGDARIDFRVPEGGFYFVEVAVADPRLGLGGDGFYYRLSITALEQVVPIMPSSGLVPVLPFELTSAQVAPGKQLRLKEINIILEDVGPPYGDFNLSDLAPITNDINSGISIFNDAGLSTGQFDYRADRPNFSDQRLPLENSPDAVTVVQGLGQVRVRLKLEDSAKAVLRLTPDGKPDFYVVIRTSNTLQLGDDFKVSIPAQGLVVVEDTVSGPVRYRAFDEPFPERPNVYTGELIQIVSMTEVDQRIELNANPLAVLGINAVGDAAQNYYISEVKLLVIGYSAKNFIPFFIDRFRSIPAPETIVRATGSYGDFELSDFNPIFQQDAYRGGGIAVYKDEARVVQGGLVEGDGTFEPGIDLVVPFGSPIINEIPISQIPADYLEPLIPRQIGVDVFTMAQLGGIDLAADLNVRAFEITIPFQSSDLTRIPSTDDVTKQTGGPDFFVAVQMSNTARALDRFVVLVPDEGIRIKNNYGPGRVPTIDRPSLAYFDPTLRTQTVNAVTVRPQPFVDVNDLTKTSPSSRVLPLAAQGAGPKAVLGLNMVDFGMTTHTIPQSQSVEDIGIFFNQGYIWDSLDLDFVPISGFDPTDLRPITQQASVSNNTVFFSHGVSIFLDDDTPIGDFIDNDGDGLIDEELRDGIDNDLDGVIDEPDWGDTDDAGISGIFDERDYDNYWPPNSFTRYRFVEFVNDAEYVTAPTFPNVVQPDGNYRASFNLLARRINEEAPSVFDHINDPWTSSPDFIFLRTGFAPIWYEPLPELSHFAIRSPGILAPNGFYITLGADEEDYQDMIDLIADNEDFQFSYNHAFPIPDEDGGHGFEYLEGDDVFVVLRASGTAELGDRFRVQVPQGGISMSVYQSPSTALNVAPDGTRSFPAAYPNRVVVTEEISIGSANNPPQVVILAPAAGRNFFSQDFAYEIVYSVVDPDSTNVIVNLFLDNNNLGFDGIRLNSQPLPISQSRFTFRLTDPAIFAQLQSRYGITDVRRLTENDQFFIYIEANDQINETVKLYSIGYITIDKNLVQGLAQYLKLDRDGSIYSVGIDQSFRNVPATMANPAVDLEVLPDENAVMVLMGDGKVYGRMLPGATMGPYEPYRRTSFNPTEQDRIVFNPDVQFGVNVAVDMELVPEGPGYYILNNDGSLHAIGNVRKFEDAPYFNYDIARDMELTSSREGIYILDGHGGIHPVGRAPVFPLSRTYFGWDTARDLELTPSENGYYVLTTDGLIAPGGDAIRDLTIPGAQAGVDRGFKSIALTPDKKGFLVMDATGEVTGLRDVRVGSDTYLDPVERRFVDMEAIGLTSGNAEDLIRRYFEAYAAEDIDQIISLTTSDYLDNHGNDRIRLRQALRTIFDYYVIAAPADNAFVIEDLNIQVSSGQALVTADVLFSHRVPQITAMAVGDELALQMPFSQRIQIYEVADGRNDRLDIFRINSISGVYVPGVDRKIYSRAFRKPGFEGPHSVFLEYGGPGRNNAYQFILVDGGTLGGQLGNADVRIASYPSDSIFAASDSVQFVFSLQRETSGGFRIRQANLLQVLPEFSEDTNPVGFSFNLGGPVFDFEVGDIPDLGPADFRFIDGTLTHSLTGYPGVVNLTTTRQITQFEQFRTQDYQNLPLSLFANQLGIVPDQVYLVVSKDQRRYGLVRPIRIATAEEGGALIFDWQFRSDFVVPTR